jgi:hypothetical protein
MKVSIIKNDGTVFSSYTEEDIKREFYEELEVDEHSQPDITPDDIHSELKAWVTADMDTLRRLQEE